MFINPESKQHPTKKDFIQFLVMRNIAFLEMEKLSLPKQERRLR